MFGAVINRFLDPVDWIESCFCHDVVNSFVDFDEFWEWDGQVVDDICLMVDQKIGNQGMFCRVVHVEFSKQDFCHV